MFILSAYFCRASLKRTKAMGILHSESKLLRYVSRMFVYPLLYGIALGTLTAIVLSIMTVPFFMWLGVYTLPFYGYVALKAVFAALLGGGTASLYDGGGNITISGSASVTATGGIDGGAGIGGGNNFGYFGGSSGNITISGSVTVSATGGSYSAGIGGGNNAYGGTIDISGGTITATGGNYGAGIGSGYDGIGGTIGISCGTIYTVCGTNGPCDISDKYNGSYGALAISGSGSVSGPRQLHNAHHHDAHV